jgi:hypothetical protein
LRDKIRSFPQNDEKDFVNPSRPPFGDSSVNFFSSDRDKGPNRQSGFDSKPFSDFRPTDTRLAQPETRNSFGANRLSKGLTGKLLKLCA